MLSFNHEDLIGGLLMTASKSIFKSMENEKLATERSS